MALICTEYVVFGLQDCAFDIITTIHTVRSRVPTHTHWHYCCTADNDVSELGTIIMSIELFYIDNIVQQDHRPTEPKIHHCSQYVQ